MGDDDSVRGPGGREGRVALGSRPSPLHTHTRSPSDRLDDDVPAPPAVAAVGRAVLPRSLRPPERGAPSPALAAHRRAVDPVHKCQAAAAAMDAIDPGFPL